ncbi:MAG: sugar phosphate isomerase/epimerase [Candidatus Absconditabacteria bacterium]|nr:sugar phosphate isomerase/epimerase [Candidatus Absconditabacteria bacterium]MDD3868702.1 sugar phosphate isomerase/epimerase [Candidatus Absconditabacteria bacterium]MDD4714392.1 sugar phosphate isomerase/epimerase [Candidatus Absconditabacteria bacterium]
MRKTNALLLSTDTLPNYGLDMIFSIAKDAGYDGLDLAIWKGFDAWNEDYVQELSFKHNLPVYVIQTSNKLNQKEMDKALDLCAATGADTICINAPKITEFKVYDFISDNLAAYQKDNPDICFTILNPQDSKLLALPIPEYRFSNITDIVKKYSAYVGLDITNMDMDSFEEEFVRKLEDYAPYVSVLYFSDKSKKGVQHLVPGDGDLNLVNFLKKLKKSGYARPVSIKLDFKPQELANREKLVTQLKKAREFYEKYFLDI